MPEIIHTKNYLAGKPTEFDGIKVQVSMWLNLYKTKNFNINEQLRKTTV